MKTNRFYTIAALVLMLLLSGETIFLLNTNQHRSVLAKHVTELEQTIQRKKEENEKLTHENSQLKDSLELTNLEKQQSAEKILELEEEIKSLEKQLADAQKDLVSKKRSDRQSTRGYSKNQRQIHVQHQPIQSGLHQ